MSAGDPVAWRYRLKRDGLPGDWILVADDRELVAALKGDDAFEIEALYDGTTLAQAASRSKEPPPGEHNSGMIADALQRILDRVGDRPIDGADRSYIADAIKRLRS